MPRILLRFILASCRNGVFSSLRSGSAYLLDFLCRCKRGEALLHFGLRISAFKLTLFLSLDSPRSSLLDFAFLLFHFLIFKKILLDICFFIFFHAISDKFNKATELRSPFGSPQFYSDSIQRFLARRIELIARLPL